jgi:hypothetical protein
MPAIEVTNVQRDAGTSYSAASTSCAARSPERTAPSM